MTRRRTPVIRSPKSAVVPPGAITAPEWTATQHELAANGAAIARVDPGTPGNDGDILSWAGSVAVHIKPSRIDPAHPRYGGPSNMRNGGNGTTAIQDAVADAAERIASGTGMASAYGGTVEFAPGFYKSDPIEIFSGVTLLAAGRFGGRGSDNLPVRWHPNTDSIGADNGLIYSDPLTQIEDAAVIGFVSVGSSGGNGASFLYIPNHKDLIVNGVRAEQYRGPALVATSGNGLRLSDSVLAGLYQSTAGLASRRGVVEIGGADHEISHVSFTGNNQGSVSSANLYGHSAIVSFSSSSVDHCVFQVGDVGLGINGGTDNRYTASRFDTNAGHGLAGYAGNRNHFVNCAFNRNSAASTGTYDHISIPAGGMTNNRFDAPLFADHTTNVRYWINDGIAIGTPNRYVDPWGREPATARHAIAGISRVVYTDLRGTTAERPTYVQAGQVYFDTTLGQPIWYDGSGWVDATGTAV